MNGQGDTGHCEEPGGADIVKAAPSRAISNSDLGIAREGIAFTTPRNATYVAQLRGARNDRAPCPPVLVLGLGNPILGDDGVGWRVAEECAERIKTHPQLATLASGIEFDSHSGGGLSLAERLAGYDRVVLIDAISGGSEPPGSVACFRLEELTSPGSVHTSSAHDTSLVTALELTRRLGVRVPETIFVVAIRAENLYEFSEELSPAVQAAVPKGVERVLDQLATWALGSQGK